MSMRKTLRNIVAAAALSPLISGCSEKAPVSRPPAPVVSKQYHEQAIR
ncbi:hypothetical protein ACFL0V_02285 [Nanoarchaeota archaeon]